MNERQCYDDNKDLGKLMVKLWNDRQLIFIITLVITIITELVTVVIMSPVYETKLNIIINMPETFSTKFGDFNLEMNTNEQYIDLIKSNNILQQTIADMNYEKNIEVTDIKKNIEIIRNKDKLNSFEIIVKDDTAENSLLLAQTLYRNYINFLDVLSKERATIFFSNQYNIKYDNLNVQLQNTKRILAKNEELLSQTPQTINQRKALDEINKNTGTLDYVVMEKILNENYTKIELDIINNKQSIADIEESIRVTENYLSELKDEQNAIDYYYETGDNSRLSHNLFEIVNTCIYLPSEPVIPLHKTSPSIVKNTAIGIVLGCMIGIFVAYVKQYIVENCKNY